MTAPSPPRPRRKRSPRFLEIAAEAGVSIATVDRVLNERDSVSAATRDRVVEAARRLGIGRLLPDTHHGLIHFDVLLPRNASPFWQRLTVALERSIAMLDRRIVVHRIVLREGDDDAVVRGITRAAYPRRGLVVAAHDAEPVREALRGVIAQGISVVTMVTDIGGVERLHYAGIDNRGAGRTAAHFIGQLARRRGRVLLLRSRSDFVAHLGRVAGFRDVLAADFPHLRCEAAEADTLDDADRCYLAVTQALRASTPLLGIYNTGGGSRGIEAALRRHDLAGRLQWVAHEMSDDHRQYMEQGLLALAIDQDPDGQVLSALQHLLHACGVLERAPRAGAHEFRLYCKENLRGGHYLD
jgi:LacI family transcriptional regulator